MDRIRVGISSCLLGEAVRYDGGHKFSSVCVNALAEYFDYQPVCPEVGIGLGVPRMPIRLVGDADNPRAVGVHDPSRDVTDDLRAYVRLMLPRLAGISGYIFIRNSPSCGLFDVKVYREGWKSKEGEEGETEVHGLGRGIFAREITEAMPGLPVEEAGRLEDPAVREDFIRRVYAYRRRLKSGISKP